MKSTYMDVIMDILQRKIAGAYFTSTLIPPFGAGEGFPGVRILWGEQTIDSIGQCARPLEIVSPWVSFQVGSIPALLKLAQSLVSFVEVIETGKTRPIYAIFDS